MGNVRAFCAVCGEIFGSLQGKSGVGNRNIEITMEVNELRLGNYVIVDNPEFHPKLKDVVLKVYSIGEIANQKHSIGLDHILQEENLFYERYSQRNEFVRPIEITKEELLRFGYELMPSDTWIMPNSGIFIFFDEELQASIAGEILIPIKYIHQLQNLVFDLYGKELTYKK
jgi:hypothetical protein